MGSRGRGFRISQDSNDAFSSHTASFGGRGRSQSTNGPAYPGVLDSPWKKSSSRFSGGNSRQFPGVEETPWTKKEPPRSPFGQGSSAGINQRDENNFGRFPSAGETPWTNNSSGQQRSSFRGFSGGEVGDNRNESFSGFCNRGNQAPMTSRGGFSDNSQNQWSNDNGVGFRNAPRLSEEGSRSGGAFGGFSEGPTSASKGGFSSGFGNAAADGGSRGGFANPGYSKGFQEAEAEGKRENSYSQSSGRGFGRDKEREDTRNLGGFRARGFAEIIEEMKITEERKWASLPPIKKHFYEEHPEVTAMYPEEVAQLRREKNGIQVDDLSEGGGRPRVPPKPVFKFEHAFEKYPELLEQLTSMYKEPSPIQCQLWPVAMSGLDAIGIAQTGSGKTIGFLLPIFLHIDGKPEEERRGPSCLVLTPTRELAQQIEREVRKYHYRGIRSVCIYGGGDRRQQCLDCGEGVDIIIATPGRLNDLMSSSVINLKTVTFLVLDEADRMLDMGFEPQINCILVDVRPDRHTIMTSATWPRMVREIARKYTKDAFLIHIGSLDLAACHSVKQIIKIVEEEDKWDLLLEFVGTMTPEDKALIFVGRKRTADYLSGDLIRQGVQCQCMHGDRDQRERERALKEMRKGTVRLLVATDVASRGLDITDITHVINYDFPKNMEEYVHRVGRTGRAGKTGKSITFVTRKDWAMAAELRKILTEANQEVPDELIGMADRYSSSQERRRLEGGGYRQPDRQWFP